MDSFEVVTAALEKHARTLTSLADELRGALDLAGGVNLTGEAYGQTAARFATAVDQLARLGQEMLRDGVDALESTGTTIRETAAAYARHDSAEADRLAGIGGEVG